MPNAVCNTSNTMIGPAMLAKVTDASGLFAAVHITWLKADGSGKADLEGLPLHDVQDARGKWVSPGVGNNVKQKLILGAMRGKGCVIRLTRGASGLTPEEAAAQGVSGLTGVGEGVEDGYSVAMSVIEQLEARREAARMGGGLAEQSAGSAAAGLRQRFHRAGGQ